MNYETFQNRLENLKRRYGHHLIDMDVSANKIRGVSFLILKNKDGKIVDCIILSDERKKNDEISYEPNEDCIIELGEGVPL